MNQKNHSTLSISNKLCGSQMVNHTLDGFYIIYTTYIYIYIYVEREYTNCKYSNCTYIYIYIYCEFQWHAAPEVRIHLCVSSRLLWSKGPLMPILGIAEENVVCEPFGYCVAWCEDSYPITTWRSYLFAWRGIHSPLTDSWIGYLLPHIYTHYLYTYACHMS